MFCMGLMYQKLWIERQKLHSAFTSIILFQTLLQLNFSASFWFIFRLKSLKQTKSWSKVKRKILIISHVERPLQIFEELEHFGDFQRSRRFFDNLEDLQEAQTPSLKIFKEYRLVVVFTPFLIFTVSPVVSSLTLTVSMIFILFEPEFYLSKPFKRRFCDPCIGTILSKIFENPERSWSKSSSSLRIFAVFKMLCHDP